ncbi:MAG: tetratricopeptide repeat protein [Alphaproteobacteria bacterium]|nr:tetratricopeptide repeat protein [Alphaproteobacteria bacterium]
MPAKKKNVKTMPRRAAAKPVVHPAVRVAPVAKTDSSRFALYIYWLIIVFFVGATFYVLGRGYSIMNPVVDNVEISERMDMSQLSEQERIEIATRHLNSGRDKLVAGQAADAITDLTVALEAAPFSAIAFVLRGEAYMQLADYERALADLNNALRLDPDSAIAFYDRAMLEIRQENFNAAVADLGLALEANQRRPSDILSNHDIFSRRAQIMLWNKDWHGAIADYTAAIGEMAGDFRDYAGRAEAYTAIGQFKLAANDYLVAIAIIADQVQNVSTDAARRELSTNAQLFFEKSAALHVMMGDTSAARVDLESATTLANALGDTDTVIRLQKLIAEL